MAFKTLNLRPYQMDSSDKARESYQKGNRRIIACLPTGGGKTVLFSYLVSISKKKVLILTDRKELLSQAANTLSGFGINCNTIKSGGRIEISERCVVAMVETWIRRIKKHPELLNFGLVIIDECHKGCFRKVLDALPDTTYVLGTTATPLSSKKQFPLKDQYQDIINTVDIPDLVELGFLNPSITYSAKIDRSGLRMEAGEYSDASQMSMYDKREVYEGLISKWRKYADGRKTICFNVNVEHSEQVCREFNDAGVSAKHLDGNTPDAKRDQILADFRDGKFQVLCNVGIVTTGYDEPTVACIIVNRATTSMPLYLQMCGRGSRLSAGKKDFIILDMGENYKYLNGTWDTPREWKEIFLHPKKANEGLAPVKKCPHCEAIIRASLMQCPYCFHVITPKEQKAIDKDIEFELIKMQLKKKEEKVPLPKPDPREWHSLDIPRVADLVRSGTYKPGWAVRLLKARPNPTKQLEEFSNTMGYKPTWVNWALSL